MTEAEVQKLRDGGISDAVILEMQKEESTSKGEAAPVATATSELPEIDPNTPSKVYTQAKTNDTPTEGSGATFAQGAMELAPAIGSGLVAIAPYAAGAAGLYGGSKLLGAAKTAADAYKTGVATAADTAQRNIALQEAKMAERAARAGQQVRPVVPTATAGVPTAPVAPVAPPPTPVAQAAGAAEQGLANRVKQTAASRITGLMPSMGEALGAAGRFAARTAAPFATLAGYSGDLGPKTPQTGRMKGMEINPLTNAPWTPQQIAQYEANPAQYDQQMSPPQFRR
jgi:hypothetical protein